MSKSDDMRAMREARYERARANAAGKPKAAPQKAQRPAPTQVETKGPAADPVVKDVAGEGLCGHRSISGRNCTREHGHAAKSHRYS